MSIFSHINELVYNMKNKLKFGEERPYACSECSFKFKKKQYLERHSAVHSTEKKFSCWKCGSSYKYKKGLNRHVSRAHVMEWKAFKMMFPKKKPCRQSDVWYPPSIYEFQPIPVTAEYHNRAMLFWAWSCYQLYLFFLGQIRFNL
ncbi:unnamed protein product [Blepharisma stoltei]|uniref:C2H2-type domain-containing protein n=1 Tax=Blepharisma stoltei TaxID=1481888 RepID=A0AAU9K6I0_9CILI|nr:unnamed protein product [Blepharisma stoltei]